MGDFIDTEHFEWLAASARYLRAARVLVDSPEFTKDLGLFLPTLQLTAHGIELLLKGNLIGAGMSPAEVEGFHHRLRDLWQEPRNAMLRNEVSTIAQAVRLDAEKAGRWDGGNKSGAALIEEYVRRLAPLHGRETRIALRYPSQGLKGPRAPFLVETFERAARLALGQPERLLPR